VFDRSGQRINDVLFEFGDALLALWQPASGWAPASAFEP
jgi:hypothetical protein